MEIIIANGLKQQGSFFDLRSPGWTGFIRSVPAAWFVWKLLAWLRLIDNDLNFKLISLNNKAWFDTINHGLEMFVKVRSWSGQNRETFKKFLHFDRELVEAVEVQVIFIDIDAQLFTQIYMNCFLSS